MDNRKDVSIVKWVEKVEILDLNETFKGKLKWSVNIFDLYCCFYFYLNTLLFLENIYEIQKFKFF